MKRLSQAFKTVGLFFLLCWFIGDAYEATKPPYERVRNRLHEDSRLLFEAMKESVRFDLDPTLRIDGPGLTDTQLIGEALSASTIAELKLDMIVGKHGGIPKHQNCWWMVAPDTDKVDQYQFLQQKGLRVQ